jgi:hypothetical protein
MISSVRGSRPLKISSRRIIGDREYNALARA